jgi:hypothetical protein
MNIKQKNDLLKLKTHGTELKMLVETDASYEKKMREIEAIKQYLDLLKDLIDIGKMDDTKTLAWRKVENRILRAKRLFDLGAPKMIIEHEVKWLTIMIEHMDLIFNGIEPEFTEEQKKELEWEKEMQA